MFIWGLLWFFSVPYCLHSGMQDDEANSGTNVRGGKETMNCVLGHKCFFHILSVRAIHMAEPVVNRVGM